MNRFVLLAALAALAFLGAASASSPGAPIVTSSTHPSGVPVNETVAEFAWTTPSGMTGTIRFLYLLSANATSEPGERDNATSTASASILVPALGDWYFHVVAVDGSGRSATAHYGPVAQYSGLSEACLAAFRGADSSSDGGPEQLEKCIAGTQTKFAPQAIMAVFMGFLVKFGSATLKRG